MSTDLFNDTLTATALGALIGSSLTLIGVCLTHWMQKRETARRDVEHIHGSLQAFHDEIETLWEVYQAGAGTDIAALASNEPMLSHWPLTQDYFTIYNANASSIGKIKNQELRKQVIATYTKARTMIDTVRLNNDLLQQWERDCFLFQETRNPVHESHANARYKTLVEYAKALKESHSGLESAASELLHHLQKNPYGHPARSN